MSPEEQARIEWLASDLDFSGFIVADLIACGDFGCTFWTNRPDVVVKIGRQWSEHQFAVTIIEQDLQHPNLPQIFGAFDLREALEVPYYAIVREDIPDLADIDTSSTSWLNEILADLDYQAEDAESSDELLDMAVEMLATRPGLPNEELIFEKIVELTAWCYDHGILLGDTLASNFGRALNGEVKLRDLGGARFRDASGEWR